MKKLLCGLVIITGMVSFFGMATTMQPAYADVGANVLTHCADEANQDKNGEGKGIWCILNIILTIMTFGVVTLATLGLIISGAQYITSGDSPEKMAKAKSRIINVVIGLAAYAVLWAALNWLLPGGIFHT